METVEEGVNDNNKEESEKKGTATAQPRKRLPGSPFKKSDFGAKLKEDANKGSEITIREFLDFLKTAYQVQDNIEGILRSEGLTDIVDWLELKENSLVKPNEIAVQTSEPKINKDEKKGIVQNDLINLKKFFNQFLCTLLIPKFYWIK